MGTASPTSPPSSSVVGRLAPSPTGRVHLGHARSFLLAWWSIRSQGGRVLLRIEDLDQDRARQEWRAAIVRDLSWLGLDWDGEVEVQSEHLAGVDEAVQRLVAAGAVYPCVCTRREVREAASAPHDEATSSMELAYPGTCRGRFGSLAQAEAETGRPAALRFAVDGAAGTEASPTGRTLVRFHDELQGDQAIDLAHHGGDFVVVRKGGLPAYQLAVVEADARVGVTEVLRGDDLLVSTARQKLLQRALGLPHPRWIHVPLVVDVEGQRLAKRRGGLSLAELRDRGVSATQVRSWVAQSAGLELEEGSGPAPSVSAFSPSRLSIAQARVPGDFLEDA